jgi:hypothetical protein
MLYWGSLDENRCLFSALTLHVVWLYGEKDNNRTWKHRHQNVQMTNHHILLVVWRHTA